MNNYSQCSLICTCLILCTGLLSSHVLAAYPDSDSNSTTSKKPELVLLDSYLSGAQNQIAKVSQFIPGYKQKENKKNSPSIEPINLSTDKTLIATLRKYVYDPDHPSELLGKIIYGYGFYSSMESQCILWGQRLLGKNNQIIVSIKQNHKNTTAYLEALKEQKSILDKQQNSPKLESLLLKIK